MLTKPIINIRSDILAKPTYEEFASAFSDRYGRLPIGTEQLAFFAGNKAECQKYCPNPAKVRA